MAERRDLSRDQYRRRSRRSFLTGGAAVAAGFMGWRGVQGSPADRRIPGVLRDVHGINESIWSSLFREDHLAKEFAREDASILRINGRIGIDNEIDLDRWQVTVQGPDGEEWGTHTLADIRALPRHEMTIEHKCIEGWAQVTNWGGARFSDVIDLYADRIGDDITDVGMETPDRRYYVSMDMATMRHPQTLLAYDMLDQPLDDAHGAPLRLATPLKYGIKQLKRIGVIQFRREPGRDYWGDRGYDDYVGL